MFRQWEKNTVHESLNLLKKNIFLNSTYWKSCSTLTFLSIAKYKKISLIFVVHVKRASNRVADMKQRDDSRETLRSSECSSIRLKLVNKFFVPSRKSPDSRFSAAQIETFSRNVINSTRRHVFEWKLKKFAFPKKYSIWFIYLPKKANIYRWLLQIFSQVN